MRKKLQTRRIRLAILLATMAAAFLSAVPHAASHSTAEVLPPSASSE